MHTAIFTFTQSGFLLGINLAKALEQGKKHIYTYRRFISDSNLSLNDDCILHFIEAVNDGRGLGKAVGDEFAVSDALIFIGATGIAVRSIAAYVNDKFKDPAVLCIDETGRFVIPILSGHVGGANRLAYKISELIGSTPVITTATDIRNVWAVDVFAKENLLEISDRKTAKKISAALLEGKSIGFLSDYKVRGTFPEHVLKDSIEKYNVYITNSLDITKSPALCKIGQDSLLFAANTYNFLKLIPKNICIGIGCRKGADFYDMLKNLKDVLKKHNIDIRSVSHIASIDVKKDEVCIKKLAGALNTELCFFTADELKSAYGSFNDSEFVKKTVGVGNVCERSCMLVYGDMLFKKEIYPDMTFAASVEYSRVYNI